MGAPPVMPARRVSDLPIDHELDGGRLTMIGHDRYDEKTCMMLPFFSELHSQRVKCALPHRQRRLDLMSHPGKVGMDEPFGRILSKIRPLRPGQTCPNLGFRNQSFMI
jgi:hypothetical protein